MASGAMAFPIACPCDPRRRYATCCAPWHAGTPAAHAEALMRSRYSAFALRDSGYLLATWHLDTRPLALDLHDAANAQTTWLGLSVRDHRVTGPDRAEVEFVARYRIGGASASRLHERSRFGRLGGRWFYLDGATPPART